MKGAGERARELAVLIDEIEMHCPCGARPESLNTHPHVSGCPVERLKRLCSGAPREIVQTVGVEELWLKLRDLDDWDETLDVLAAATVVEKEPSGELD